MRRRAFFPARHNWVGCLSLALALAASGARAADPEAPRVWEFDLGAGVTYGPNYLGASAASSRMRIWADGAYRTSTLGTFALDSGSLTIAPQARWDFVDTTDLGIGALVGYRTGRNDRNPGFASATDGASRLSGLPNVADCIDAGASAHVTVGVPLFVQLRSATHGSQGTIVILGAYLPTRPDTGLELTILPTITWIDGRQMRAMFGVSASTTETSAFPPYNPGGGWQDASIEVVGDWHVSGNWHLTVSFAYQRLLASAARSPLVQTANQPSALVGVLFAF